MENLLRVLMSRTTALVLLASGVGFAGVVWMGTRPPNWQAWAGETTLAVQVAGAAPAPARVSLRGSDATAVHRGVVQGDRLLFSGLSPETAYVVEWHAGPFVPAAMSVSTLPPLLPLVELDVVPGPGEMVITPRTRDARLAGVELALAAGSKRLETRDGGFVVTLPDGDASTELALLLPGTGEGHPLEFAAPGAERLIAELARVEAELEPLLAAVPAPAFVEMSALERWQPAPIPARKMNPVGGPGLLAHLRRLAPVVRASAGGRAPAALRWKLAAGAVRLAGAEVLARKHQQPNLGVLDWASDLVRFAPFDNRTLRKRPNLIPHPAHLMHPSFEKNAASSLVNVIGGTADSVTVNSLPIPAPALAANNGWVGISFVFEALFNSAPPRLTFPRMNLELELPLVQHGPGERMVHKFSKSFPESDVDVWLKTTPAEDWTGAAIESSFHERSGRVSPTYVRVVRANPAAPPKR